MPHRTIVLIMIVWTLAGCRLTGKRDAAPPGPPGRLDAIEGLKGDTGVVRSDFRSELGPSQLRDTHLDLARAYEIQGNFDAAIVEYQNALEVTGKRGRDKGSSTQRALAHRRLAAAFDRLGRFAQAETHYREALRLSPGDPKVWNDHGYSQYLQGRWEDAEKALRTAARLAPEDPRIQTNLGLCLAAAGKTAEALEALTSSGGPAVGRVNLGYILAAAGKTAEARSHYEAALRLQPNLLPARAALAQLDRAASADTSQVADSTSAGDRGLARASTTGQ